MNTQLPRICLASLAVTGLTAACVQANTLNDTPAIMTIGQDPVFKDQIADGTSLELEGHYLEYRYVTGSSYRLSFDGGYVTAKEIDSPRPQVVRAYLARQMRPKQYIVHWMAQDPNGNDRKGHIALVLDFETGGVFGTAVLPNGMQIFDHGEITITSFPYARTSQE